MKGHDLAMWFPSCWYYFLTSLLLTFKTCVSDLLFIYPLWITAVWLIANSNDNAMPKAFSRVSVEPSLNKRCWVLSWLIPD